MAIEPVGPPSICIVELRMNSPETGFTEKGDAELIFNGTLVPVVVTKMG